MPRIAFSGILPLVLSMVATAAGAQCLSDADCKGDRLCEDGVCVFPEDVERPRDSPTDEEPPPEPAPTPSQTPAPVSGEIVEDARPDPAPQPSTPTHTIVTPPPGRHSGPFAMWRTGLELELRVGVAVCVDDGQGDDAAECDSIEEDGGGEYGYRFGPGGGFGAVFTGRFLPFLGAGVDFGYYMFTIADIGNETDGFIDNYRIRTMNLMLQVRGYLPFRYADIFIKVSAGYLSVKEMYEIEGGLFSYRAYSPINVKLGIGATFYFVQDKPIGDIGLGLDADFVLTNPLKWEFCDEEEDDCGDGDWNGDSEGDPDGAEVINSLQISLHFTWIFTIF